MDPYKYLTLEEKFIMALELKRREVAKLYKIAEKFNIRLMTELPVVKSNLMKVL